MEKGQQGPQKSVFLHFRFKFLAITSIAFLIYIVLSSSAEFSQFSSSPQFKLMGPFFLGAGLFYLVFRKFPIKCPYCYKVLPTKTDWTCPHCNLRQGRERYLMDKCFHCKQLTATSSCSHCKKEFKL